MHKFTTILRYAILATVLVGAGLQENVMAQAQKEFPKKDEKAIKNVKEAKILDHVATAKTPAGTIDFYPEIASDHRAPRPVEVWTPLGYDPDADERYPVIYMHDGQFNLHHGHTPFEEKDWLWDMDTTMTRLIEAGEIRPSIVVSIWADLDVNGNRGLEFMPQKVVTEEVRKSLVAREGRFKNGEIISDNYLKFLVKDLKPFVDKTYRTLPDRANTYVMGSSMGGLISAYAVTEYPEVFGHAACLSTDWTSGDGAVLAWCKDHLPEAGNHRLYFDYGTETLDADYEPYQMKMDDIMRSKGYKSGEDWITRKFEGADHSPKSWRERLHIPLEFLLSKR